MARTEDYIIIKYYERFALELPGIPDAFPAWWRVTVRHNSYGKVAELRPVTRAKALELIRAASLVEVHRDRDGIVFDTPEHGFWRRHAGCRVPSVL